MKTIDAKDLKDNHMHNIAFLLSQDKSVLYNPTKGEHFLIESVDYQGNEIHRKLVSVEISEDKNVIYYHFYFENEAFKARHVLKVNAQM